MGKTLDDIAWEALFEAMTKTKREELLGAILPDGTYTEPHNHAFGKQRSGHTRAYLPANLRALFHNHPYGTDNEMFSADDVETANRLGVPSYIAVQQRDGTPSGAEIKRYDPGDPAERRGEAHGKKVLAQFPIESWQAWWDAQLRNE